MRASCHCGAVCIKLETLPATYTECNCSICSRYAAQWLYLTADEVEVEAVEGAIKYYQWGDHEIDFCHCRICGSVTHYCSLPLTKNSRVAINGRILGEKFLSQLKKKEFDGAAM